jgi:hypothetical protein
MPGVFARSEIEQVRRMIPRENSFLTGASGSLILKEEAYCMKEFWGLAPKKPIVREAKKNVTQVLDPDGGPARAETRAGVPNSKSKGFRIESRGQIWLRTGEGQGFQHIDITTLSTNGPPWDQWRSSCNIVSRGLFK